LAAIEELRQMTADCREDIPASEIMDRRDISFVSVA
jgi:hypothetical protein